MTLRERIVCEAQSWLRTPYLHMARVKGSGCDCATFLIGVYQAVGVLGAVDLPKNNKGEDWYDPEWNMHRSEELYLKHIIPYVDAADVAQVGDIVLFRAGRTVSHAGIWLGYDNKFIHCWRPSGGVTEDMLNDYWLPRLHGAYKVKGVDDVAGR